MLPASNRGIGMSLNFPDVCKVPAPPAPFIPTPFPNMGMNMQAVPFSPFVFVTFIPATNMSSMKVMTSGDEGGVMGGLIVPMIKGPGRTTMGNPIVMVTGLPGNCLATPNSGNMNNAPIGIQCVPSQPFVFYTYKSETTDTTRRSDSGEEPGAMSVDTMAALDDVSRGSAQTETDPPVRCQRLQSGALLVRIALFSSCTDQEVFNELQQHDADAHDHIILDLRGNPGGDAEAALRLAADFLPKGTTMALLRQDIDDDEPLLVRTQPSWLGRLAILTDQGTASAAELLAGALQSHGRAQIIGQTTHGKGTAQQMRRSDEGALRYETVAEYLLASGERLQDRGITPNIAVEDAPATAGHDTMVAAAERSFNTPSTNGTLETIA